MVLNSKRSLKILHSVESYHPELGGMQELVKQVSERLVKRGHIVTVVTSASNDRREKNINGVSIKSFNLSGNLVNGINGNQEEYLNYVLKSDFDIIINWMAQSWSTDILLPHLEKIKYKKGSVVTGFSGFYKEEYKEYFHNMKSWMKSYDINFFSSNNYRDINFSKSIGLENNVVVLNGASKSEFENNTINFRKKIGIKANKKIILHVGSLTGTKGQEEAVEIYKKAKIKNSVLVFIGNRTDRLLGYYGKIHRYIQMPVLKYLYRSNIVALGAQDRELIVAAYKAADLFLFPSNTECSPIVIVECLASKTPFLATDVGNIKELSELTKAGEIMPTKRNEIDFGFPLINESAEQLKELIKNNSKLEELGNNGYKSFLEKFTWDKVVDDYEQNYYKIIK